MKWVLRAAGTNFFVTREGGFTNEIEEAYDLPNITKAIELCHRRSLIGMELVLRVGSCLEATIQMGEMG